MDVLIYIAVIAAILILVFLLTRKKRAGKDSGDAIPELRCVSPLGISVVSGLPVDADILDTMDASLSELFDDARALGYTEKLKHSDYTIIVKEDCVDRNGTLSWLTRADNYDGTEYDQNPEPGIGWVYCAEQVLFRRRQSDWQLEPTMEYVICRGSLGLIANTTRYGCEHLILLHNSFEKYKETETHRDGEGHPIIQRRNK